MPHTRRRPQHPHNSQYEFYPNPWLFDQSFEFTHAFDARWGQANKSTAILVRGPSCLCVFDKQLHALKNNHCKV